MWMDYAPLSTASDEGRMMTAREKMNSLGVGMYPEYCESLGLRYPIFGAHQFDDAALSTEAGNGMNILSIGGCTCQAMCFLQRTYVMRMLNHVDSIKGRLMICQNSKFPTLMPLLHQVLPMLPPPSLMSS